MMETELFNGVVSYFQGNTYAAIGAAVVLVLLVWKKTKLFFITVLIALFLFGVFYMINSISEIGVTQKRGMIQERQVPEN